MSNERQGTSVVENADSGKNGMHTLQWMKKVDCSFGEIQ